MKISKRYFLFLVFLIGSQELCLARRLPTKLKALDADTATSLVAKHRQKRSISAILFGAALFASIANIAFDITLQVKGCCLLYPDACEYQDQFDAAKLTLDTTSGNIDAKWGLAQNLLTYVQYSSSRNEEISLELKRITQSYENILETIDPEIINKYNNISNGLKEEIEASNQTVLNWNNAELDTAFTSLMETSIGRLQMISGLLGVIAEGSMTYLWNWYKTVKIKTFIKSSSGSALTNVQNNKALRIIGTVDADSYITETAVARRKADVAVSRGARAMAFAANAMYVVQVGVEIWMAILKVQQCKDVRDNVRDAYHKIQPEIAEMDELYDEVSDHYDNLTMTYSDIKTQISSEEFFGYLESIKNLTEGSSVQSPATATTATTIENFIDTIGATTDYQTIWNMQGDLIGALESITFTLDCYYKKVQAYTVITNRCQSGEDTLREIYDTVTEEFDTNDNACTVNASLVYTSFEDVQTYSNAMATEGGYNADCLLNNAVLQDSVCSKKCTGATDATIAEDLSLTTAYVSAFIENCPDSCPLTPAETDRVCMFKGFRMSLEQMVAAYPNNDPADVEAAYNSCP